MACCCPGLPTPSLSYNSPNPWQPHYQQPNVFIPPGYVSPTYDFQSYQPLSWSSARYPTLNPILASDTTRLMFDVRKNPRENIHPPTYLQHAHLPATSNGVNYLRIVSKAFPWAIDCQGDTAIRCDTVWDALYLGLQVPILDQEWGLIIGRKKHREAMETAARKRLALEPSSDERFKRIDYLGEATMFKGLDKDADFVKLRLLPGDRSVRDTWVVKFG